MRPTPLHFAAASCHCRERIEQRVLDLREDVEGFGIRLVGRADLDERKVERTARAIHAGDVPGREIDDVDLDHPRRGVRCGSGKPHGRVCDIRMLGEGGDVARLGRRDVVGHGRVGVVVDVEVSAREGLRHELPGRGQLGRRATRRRSGECACARRAEPGDSGQRDEDERETAEKRHTSSRSALARRTFRPRDP